MDPYANYVMSHLPNNDCLTSYKGSWRKSSSHSNMFTCIRDNTTTAMASFTYPSCMMQLRHVVHEAQSQHWYLFLLSKYSRQNQYKGTGSEKETSKKDHIRLYETTPSDALLDWSLNDIHDSWKIDCTLKKALLTQISGKKKVGHGLGTPTLGWSGSIRSDYVRQWELYPFFWLWFTC